MRIAIAGTGYVGLVTGVVLSTMGHEITMFDVDKSKIDTLRAKKSPIFEKDLEELLIQCYDRMIFTTEKEEAYKDKDVVMIAVPTPERRDGSANLQYLYDVCQNIVEFSNGCLVVIKSTAPVGTCKKIARFFEEQQKGRFLVATNPEFLAQGTAVWDTLHPARIVVGSESKEALEMAKKIYAGMEGRLILTESPSAEMIKYASNDFLALKLSYINEIANLCEIIQADIETVTYGMGLDTRIGSQYLKPGTGYGGSCFPKDTKALHWLARYHDYELKTIKSTIEINENQKIRLFKKSRKYYGSLKGCQVAVLGLAFKPGTDDLREAPSLDVIRLCVEEGATVMAWDPAAAERFEALNPGTAVMRNSIEDTIEGADLCFIMTEWDEIKQFPIIKYQQRMKHPILIDGRNCYKKEEFEETEIVYDSIGRRTINAQRQPINEAREPG